jgi:EAL domain-containing protein (putative c-di-GMP-specific phosphodiesterase class I)
MRTLPFTESISAAAWLESPTHEGQEPIRAEITTLPFTIGRNGGCDLTIDSTRISREHMRIEGSAAGYTVRDLGSTNGTFLNGARIQESALRDGDLLAVAHISLIFRAPSGAARLAVTQQFTEPHQGIEAEADPINGRAIVEAVRRLEEITLHRGLRHRLQAIVNVHNSEAMAYEVAPHASLRDTRLQFDSRLPPDLACRALLRAYDMYRRMAVEQMWSYFGDVLLFLSVSPHELGSPELLDSLERLLQRPGGTARLVLQVPEVGLSGQSALADFQEELASVGVQLAIDNFTGGTAQLAWYQESAPAYLRLAPPYVQGLGRSPDQRLRAQEVVEAAAALNIQVIAGGVKSEEQWHACKSIGVPLVQGDYAAAPLPLEGYPTAGRAKR